MGTFGSTPIASTCYQLQVGADAAAAERYHESDDREG
jgi:hypothetical protein